MGGVDLLADDGVHPGGVALGDLEAGQGAGLDDEVVDAELDVLSLHFLHGGGRAEPLEAPDTETRLDTSATYSVEFLPQLQHPVHADVHGQVVVRDGLLGLHQPLSDHLQDHHRQVDQLLGRWRSGVVVGRPRQRSLTLRMLLMGISVKVPPGAAVAAAGAAAAGAAAGAAAAATACQRTSVC